MPLLITIGIIILILVLMYNSLISKKNQVDNIFASVDTQLKKRFDLIPNLVSTAKQYMEHESSIFENITKLRTEAMKPNISDKEKINLDSQMSSALGSIMVAVENYPDLKADKNILQLQNTLHEVEAQIAAARRAYNQAVTDYNNALEMFPSNFMAKWMNYTPKEVFEISENERKNLDIKELFNS